MGGELRVANEEQTKALLKLLIPLITSVPEAQVILVTCLPRYTSVSCCSDSSHMVGRDAGHKKRVLSDLVQMKKNVRAFALKENLTKIKIVDPVQLLDGIDTDGHPDPIHPPEALYDKLAEQLAVTMEGGGQGPAGNPMEPDLKRIRLISYGAVRGGAGGWTAYRGGRGGGRGGQRGGHCGRGRRSF